MSESISYVGTAQWETFFRVEGPYLLDAPLYPVLGNHEASGVDYLYFFELPENSPSPETCYATRYATTLFIGLDEFLNDYDDKSEQYDWLEAKLIAAAVDPCIRCKVVVMHAGPYSSGVGHGSNITVRNDLNPLFERYGVDLVFAGHDHHYERSTVNGVKYVVTGGGGAPLRDAPGDWWTEVVETTLRYCVLDVDGPRLDYAARRDDGTVLDSFVLGDGVSECTAAADCLGREDCGCEPSERGDWHRVNGGCIWSCRECGPDADADGFTVLCDSDCDDAAAGVFPGAAEATCDGIDNDCDPGTLDAPDGDDDGARSLRLRRARFRRRRRWDRRLPGYLPGRR